MKTEAGSTTRYIFSGSKVIAEYVNGVLGTEYIYAGSQLLATISGGTTRYHHPDHLSVRVTTDAQGTKLGEQAHYPFGETWYETGTPDKWKFTSYERDSESGLDYAIFRYDSSRLGRFMTPDPLAGSILNPQSLNRYAYVRNNPPNLVDPLGLNLWAPCGYCVQTWRYNGEYWYLVGEECGSCIDGGGGDGFGDDFPSPRGGGSPRGPGGTPQPQARCLVSVQPLNDYLQSKRSPLAGQGDALMNAGRRYDVDPRFIVALAGAETTFGTNITRGQYNAWNWLYSGRNSPFSSWGAGINAVTRGIGQGPYYFQATPPRTDTSSIYAKYCQGSDCANGLDNLNRFLKEQDGDPNSLRFPCK